MTLPLSQSDWESLGLNASILTINYPESSFSDLGNDYTKWHSEGLKIAEEIVYKNINEGELPSDDYIALGKIIAERQVAKAGYRLANLLTQIYGRNQMSKMNE